MQLLCSYSEPGLKNLNDIPVSKEEKRTIEIFWNEL
jgi:hypothetical protein